MTLLPRKPKIIPKNLTVLTGLHPVQAKFRSETTKPQIKHVKSVNSVYYLVFLTGVGIERITQRVPSIVFIASTVTGSPTPLRSRKKLVSAAQFEFWASIEVCI